jgi:hypothetical protein
MMKLSHYSQRSLRTVLTVAAMTVSPFATAQTVTVLSFDGDAMPPEARTTFYGQLRAQIDFHGTYRLNDVPEQTFGDLMLSMGCLDLDADCSAIIRDVIGSDYIAWGEFRPVEAGEGVEVALFLWNLETSQMERERVHPVPEGREVTTQVAGLLSRSLLHDSPGQLTIDSDAASALVFVNGELQGAPPVVLENQTIGRVLVRIEAPGMAAREELVSVDLTATSVDWELLPAVSVREQRDPRDRGPGLRIASLSMLGAGAIALGTGIAFGASSSATQNEFDDALAQPVFDLAEVQTLQDRGESQAGMANIMIVTGSALLVGGAITMIVDSLGRADEPEPGSAASFRVSPAIGRRYTGVTANWQF